MSGRTMSQAGIAVLPILAAMMPRARGMGADACRAKAARCEVNDDRRGAHLWRAAAELVEWEAGT